MRKLRSKAFQLVPRPKPEKIQDMWVGVPATISACGTPYIEIYSCWVVLRADAIARSALMHGAPGGRVAYHAD